MDKIEKHSSKENDKKIGVDKKLDFLASHFMKIYDLNLRNFDQFDQKMSWFFIFQGTLFVFILQSDKYNNSLLIGLLILNLFLCGYILFPGKVKAAYSTKMILDKFWLNTEKQDIKIQEAQAQMVVNLSDAIETNKRVLRYKMYLSKWAIFIFICILWLFLIKINCSIQFYV